MVFTLYFAYYASVILYDSFFKKSDTEKEDTEDTEFVIDDSEEQVQEVIDDDEIQATRQNIKNTNKTDKENQIEQQEPIVKMEVEDQGIPIELLFAKGKSMFANVQF